jgi:hypothetical protein
MKRHMRIAVLSLAIGFFSSAVPAFAANNAAPKVSENSPVAFKTTLADLDRAAQSGDDRTIPGDRLLIIDAQIGSITNRADTDAAFTAEVELIGGAWKGEDRVDLYRAYAIFDAPKYRESFSRRSATRLLAGDRILLLCRFVGIGVDYDEKTPVSVLEALDLRRIQ